MGLGGQFVARAKTGLSLRPMKCVTPLRYILSPVIFYLKEIAQRFDDIGRIHLFYSFYLQVMFLV